MHFFESNVHVEIYPHDTQKHVWETFLLKSRHPNLPQIVLPLKLSPLAGPQGPALVQNDSKGVVGNTDGIGETSLGLNPRLLNMKRNLYRNCLSQPHHKPRPNSFSFLRDEKQSFDLIRFMGHLEMHGPGTWRLNSFMSTTSLEATIW